MEKAIIVVVRTVEATKEVELKTLFLHCLKVLVLEMEVFLEC